MTAPKTPRNRAITTPTDPDALLAETAPPQSVLSDKEGFAPAEDSTRPATEVVAESTEPTSPRDAIAAALNASQSASGGNAAVPQPESAEAARIRELEAQILRAKSTETVVPESDLTPEQRRIRELEDQLARTQAKRLDSDVEEFIPTSGDGETILLHFLEDGFTALGRVWYRGQELEFEIGSKAYEDTKDRYGKTWLALLDNEYDQVQRFGKVMFRRGPWPGTPWTDDVAVQAERKRNRMAPVLPAR